MATTSVIEIEIIDEQFKAFDAQLKAMQALIAKLPDQWKKVTKEVNEEQKAEKKANDEAEKARRKKIQEEKEVNRLIKDREAAFLSAAVSTKNIAVNLASGAISLAKWAAFGVIASGFGLGALASSASDYRKRAQGAGVSTAELRAGNIYYDKYLASPESALQGIASIQADPTQSWKLYNAGGNLDKNAFENLGAVLKNIKQQAGDKPNLVQARAMGWTDLLGGEENYIRLVNSDMKELDKTTKDIKENLAKLQVSDDNSRRWQDFWQKLRLAGQDIETKLITNLVNLQKPITDLIEAAENAVVAFLQSNELKTAIKDFTADIGSPEGKQAIHDFFEGLKMLAAAVIWVVSKIPNFVGTLVAGAKSFNYKAPEIYKGGDAQSKLFNMLKSEGVNSQVAAGFIGGLYGESKLDPTAHNEIGGGHIGIGQWGVERQKQFEKLFHHKLTTATPLDEQVAFIQYEIHNDEKATLQRLLKGSTGNDGADANIGYERYANWQNDPVERARRQGFAQQINVQINGTAGSSVPNAATAMAGTSSN